MAQTTNKGGDPAVSVHLPREYLDKLDALVAKTPARSRSEAARAMICHYLDMKTQAAEIQEAAARDCGNVAESIILPENAPLRISITHERTRGRACVHLTIGDHKGVFIFASVDQVFRFLTDVMRESGYFLQAGFDLIIKDAGKKQKEKEDESS